MEVKEGISPVWTGDDLFLLQMPVLAVYEVVFHGHVFDPRYLG
jgi:hypothetical protein